MVDHSKMRLGKSAPRHDPRTLLMAHYLQTTALPHIPDAQDWSAKVTAWPMMQNNSIGDCTCAAAGHQIQAWTSNSAAQVVLPDSAILQAYEDVSGYNPTTGQNDNGAVELDVLKYWRTTGIGGRKITAFVALEPDNNNQVMASIYIFGGCYIGVQLPLSAQTQDVWSVPPLGTIGVGTPGSWGGHAVPIVAYDPLYLTVVTWGQLKKMTWGFYSAYCDEAYAILSSNDWVNANQIAANGFDLATLNADLQAL